MKTVAILIALALGATVGSAGPALACDNFVGGVCLDKKKTPSATRKKSTRKKSTRRKKSSGGGVRASRCLTIQVKTVGTSGLAYTSNTRESHVILTNKCGRQVNTFIQLNNCLHPAPYFNPSPSNRKRSVALAPGKRKTLLITRGKTHSTQKQLLLTNIVYKGQKGGYPRPRC